MAQLAIRLANFGKLARILLSLNALMANAYEMQEIAQIPKMGAQQMHQSSVNL